MKRSLAAALVAAALVLPAAEAHANGRFPEANQLTFSESDPNHLLLRVTFGLMVSRDRGATWNWICEQAIGFNGVEDPMYALTPSRNMLATTFQGLSRTTSDGCQWEFVGGPLQNEVFIDLTTRKDDAGHVLTFSSSYDTQDDAGQIFFRSRLFETNDEGLTFSEIDAGLDTSLLGYTIDYAPSDPDRIYISATRDPGTRPRGFLLTSRDRGRTWTEIPVELTPQEVALYIAAVDPNDANRIYLRTASGSDKPTRLIVSDDGGATVREVFRADGPLQGFALSKDGSKVYVGGPRVAPVTQPNVPPETKLVGLFGANKTDLAFTRLSTIDIHCLNMQDDGLWTCSNETNGGFVVGITRDEGKTFETKMRFCDVKGPIACPAGTAVTEICAQGWPQQRALFGCDGPPEPTEQPKPPSNCDCRGAPGSTVAWGAAIFAAPAAILAFLRRRRRS